MSGFMEAAVQCRAELTSYTKKPGNTPDPLLVPLTEAGFRITMDEMLQLLDTFFAEPANRAIPITFHCCPRQEGPG
jgi:hypothetical protein